jgi:serine/threonine-protein kinase RsbW
MSRSDKGSAKPRRNVKIVKKNSQMEIPSSLDYLPKVDQFVESKLKKLKIKKDQMVDIAISVSEVVTNAVVHGNRSDPGKKVKINLNASPSQVEVIVQDEGAGFDPRCVECPIDQENLLKEAGRGILIVESLMDKVDILCGPQKGTKVKIVKLLT